MFLFSNLLTSHLNTFVSHVQSSYSNDAPFINNGYPNQITANSL